MRPPAATTASFKAQIAMFPSMLTPEAKETIEAYRNDILGWKITGAGGGGYLVMITDKEIPNTIQVHACAD